MELHRACNHPFGVTIDGITYPVERLTLRDLAGITAGLDKRSRDQLYADYAARIEAAGADADAVAALGRERVAALNAVRPMDPPDLVEYLTRTFEGMAVAVAAAIAKKSPEIGYDDIADVGFSADVVEAAHAVLGYKWRVDPTPPPSATRSGANGDGGGVASGRKTG